MHELLKNLVERLHEAAQSNLESVILYGSGARVDFNEAHSDLNVLCTVRSTAAGELSRIAAVVKWWTGTHKQPAPLFFTLEELRQSADVFAIELLDMKKSHRVLYGNEVIADIHVPMNLHRIQVERELRTTVLKLRQHFLQAAENEKELTAVLGKSFSGILTLLRHTLIALHETEPGSSREVIARIAAMTGADANAFNGVLELRETGRLQQNVAIAYGSYLAALEKLVPVLDRHVPKREWQRTSKPSL